MVLGVIDPDYFLGGAEQLEADRAYSAIQERVAQPLDLDPVVAAAGVQRIVNGKMADLIRRTVIRSGHLPQDFILYAFGGAAPVHAVGFARDLGIKTVYIFPTSPVFSALGIALADVRHTKVMTCQLPLPIEVDRVNVPLQAQEAELLELMDREGFPQQQVLVRRYASCRFRRQAVGVELELPWDRLDEGRMGELIELFGRKYHELYGEGPGNIAVGVEISGLRVDAIGLVPKPDLQPSEGRATEPPTPKEVRSIYVAGRFQDVSIYEWKELRPGQELSGPGVVESEFTTVLVPPDASAMLDPYGNVVLRL